MAKKYKQNFLKQVLVRLDFQNPLQDYKKGLNPAVVKALAKTFPTMVEQKIKLQSIEVESGQAKMSTTDQPIWTYYATNKKKHTRIEATDFYIQYDKYYSFEQLKRDFQLVFGSLIKNYGELNITRIGLRYIDEIDRTREKDIFDWKKYLNQKLFSALSIPLRKDKKFISRAFSNLEFNYGDQKLVLKYGMFNPDYPSPIRKKVFILDSDAFKQDYVPDGEVYAVLDELHSRISDLFESSLIKDGLRELMNDR